MTGSHACSAGGNRQLATVATTVQRCDEVEFSFLKGNLVEGAGAPAHLRVERG